jgi:hypothetical protein
MALRNRDARFSREAVSFGIGRCLYFVAPSIKASALSTHTSGFDRGPGHSRSGFCFFPARNLLLLHPPAKARLPRSGSLLNPAVVTLVPPAIYSVFPP